ncbi:hypothetical protein O3P69_007608 [Scylla paramamosain]|uniref:Uncharacterized protein n=1 Tax=Scylla paramamosain TaxID=85552 RepID=A0AAW0UXN2_SCYPA
MGGSVTAAFVCLRHFESAVSGGQEAAEPRCCHKAFTTGAVRALLAGSESCFCGGSGLTTTLADDVFGRSHTTSPSSPYPVKVARSVFISALLLGVQLPRKGITAAIVINNCGNHFSVFDSQDDWSGCPPPSTRLLALATPNPAATSASLYKVMTSPAPHTTRRVPQAAGRGTLGATTTTVTTAAATTTTTTTTAVPPIRASSSGCPQSLPLCSSVTLINLPSHRRDGQQESHAFPG